MLRESEERYALAAGGVDDGLWDWNLLTSEVFYSSRWQTMLGFGEHGLGSTPEEWFSRVHTEDAAGLKAAVEAHIAGVTNVLESEYRIARRDGTYVWMRCRGVAVRGANGVAVRMAGSQADVSERKAAEERLRHSALHDGLTGLPNRECFMAGLGEMLARSEQPGALPFAVFFLDIDGFKHVNDRLGHSVGDRLLIAFAQRLQSCLRCSDLLARLGGDEFAILVDPIDGATMAHQIGERIQRSIMAAFDIDGHRIYTSTSIGAVLNASPGHTADELLRNADFAMYAVKAHGGAGYQQYSERLETLHHGHAYDQPRVRRTRRSRSASQTDAPAKPESLG